jgi:hypothetical protein
MEVGPASRSGPVRADRHRSAFGARSILGKANHFRQTDGRRAFTEESAEWSRLLSNSTFWRSVLCTREDNSAGRRFWRALSCSWRLPKAPCILLIRAADERAFTIEEVTSDSPAVSATTKLATAATRHWVEITARPDNDGDWKARVSFRTTHPDSRLLTLAVCGRGE